MSIVRMRKVFRKPIKVGGRSIGSPMVIIFYGIVVIFVVGAYWSFGPPSGGHEEYASGGERVRLTADVATINGQNLPREIFMAHLQMNQQMTRSYGATDYTQMRWVKSMTLDGLIGAVLLQQAAKSENIRISREDLEAKKEERVQQIIAQRFPDTKSQRDYLQRQNISLDELHDHIMQEELRDDEGLREQIAQEKLQEMVESRVTMTDEELMESYVEIRASHILISAEHMKHQLQQERAGAEGEESVSEVTDEEADQAAREKIDGLLAQVRGGADFAEIAKNESICPSSESGGDLDWFGRGMMAAEFEEAAFALKNEGEISDVVKTDFGYHIIKLTGRRQELPEDFEANKETYREQKLSELRQRAWQQYRSELEAAAEIVIHDPELYAYRLMAENNMAAAAEQLAMAIENNPVDPTPKWELATLMEMTGQVDQAVALLEELATHEQGVRSPYLHLKLARIYEEQGKTEEAISSYTNASDWASELTQANYGIHMQVQMAFEKLERADLVAQEEEWLNEFQEKMAEEGGNQPFMLQ